MIAQSDDGGKSFRVNIPYSGIHPDHHAWWINPENPNLYTGVLTANYSTTAGSGNLGGALTRSGSTALDFTGTTINNVGAFTRDTTISGQFYNNANALAGIHTGGAGVQDDVAFGGARQ